MKPFTAIEGIPPIDYHNLHREAALRSYRRYLDSEDRLDLLKAAYHGVRSGATCKVEEYSPERIYEYYTVVMAFVSYLTPRELTQMFPIGKTYDGDRWEMKDYFSSMEAIQEHGGMDIPIGDEAFSLLYDYENHVTRVFLVNYMSAASQVYKQLHGIGIMEQFFEDKGISCDTEHTDASGKKYLTDRKTGKTVRVHRALPRHWKVIEGGE